MEYKIIADSSCELTDEMKKDMGIEIVPLTLILEDKEYIDNEKLDIVEYVESMKNCKTSPKTSCPSPSDFIEKYGGAENVFVVTLSSKLSGTYQSASTAKDIYLEEHAGKAIHVFDSLSASVGETLTCIKINELIQKGAEEPQICGDVSRYIKGLKTFFLLESLEHLAKAGRVSPIIAKAASVLDIKLIMGSDGEGSIRLVEKARGYKKAFRKLIEIIDRESRDIGERILGIAHCNCHERAIELKEEISKLNKFKDIFIVKMAGLSSTYADNKGLVIAF